MAQEVEWVPGEHNEPQNAPVGQVGTLHGGY